jgi:ABC-type transport system substrate-binding protein
MTDTVSLSVATQIYDGLLEFDSHFEVRPALAESWVISNGGKTITFKLKRGVKFHDGSELTSADCVASFERLLSSKSVVYKYYDIIQGASEFKNGQVKQVKGLKAPDKYTFIIELKNKFPPFTTVLTSGTAKILPKHLVNASDFFKQPVGTGPFKVIKSDEKEIRLVKFNEYWRETAKLEQITFKVLSEEETINAGQSGIIHDAVTYPLNGDEPIFKNGQHLTVPLAATWIIGLNARLAPFQDKATRQTFKSAFSPDEFVNKFYPGQLAANGGYIPPGFPGYMKTSKEYQSNKINKKLITLFVPIELAKAPAICKYLEESFSKNGFNVKAVPIKWEEFEKRYNAKTMQAFLFSSNSDYPDTEFLARNFESNNPDNFTGAHSKKLDQLINLARKTDSRIERGKLYEENMIIIQKLNEGKLKIS